MVELKKDELLEINGGGVISAALLTALVRGATAIFEIGRSVGTAIRRYISKNMCDFS